ncbi:MAG: PorT family protein [Crocinitomicaceae bacterium]|jgi:hypothetical protein|nr:PorT family protein [Crocinitomicaceae bacterium]
MKKTLIALFCLTLLGFGENVQAQDDKKFHFGLAIEPSINWYSPSEEKKFESDGNPLKFGFGLVTDFKLGENIWFSTGLNITTGGGSIKYLENPTDGIGYYLLDNDILEPTGKFSDIDSTADFIVLDKRNYNANYVSIPLTLKMKTKEIGMMKYFGQFGFDVSIKTKGRADDEGTPLTTGNTPDLTDLNIDSEMQPLLAGLNIGAGAEYNISGSTSLVFSANFHYGFLNAVKNTSQHLVDISASTLDDITMYTPQQFKPFAISLKVGVLF